LPFVLFFIARSCAALDSRVHSIEGGERVSFTSGYLGRDFIISQSSPPVTRRARRQGAERLQILGTDPPSQRASAQKRASVPCSSSRVA
jgi:hypothetical protein